jgi:hypothetical protein
MGDCRRFSTSRLWLIPRTDAPLPSVGRPMVANGGGPRAEGRGRTLTARHCTHYASNRYRRYIFGLAARMGGRDRPTLRSCFQRDRRVAQLSS